MAFTRREKVLTGIIGVLTLLLLFLLFKIGDYKIHLLNLESLNRSGDTYSGPPPIEDSIEDAGIIFLCKPDVQQETVKYEITEIVYKDKKLDFPYALGDYYPPIQKKVRPGIHYGGDQLVT